MKYVLHLHNLKSGEKKAKPINEKLLNRTLNFILETYVWLSVNIKGKV